MTAADMAAEDFAWFLERRPGAYIGSAMALTPISDAAQPALRFQRRIMALGASYWARLAEPCWKNPLFEATYGL